MHAPLNIANDAWSLSRGERAIGVEADVATIRTNVYGDAPDIDLVFAGRQSLSRQLAKATFVWRALREYDVFHYAFASSILDYGNGPFELTDLRLAHRVGKCVAMTLHGCDVRPAQPGGCALCDSGCSASRAARRLEKMRHWVDLLYVTTPDLLKVVPEARLLPASVWDIARTEIRPPSVEGPMRVVHAPSDRAIKGTAALISAVDSLRAEGVDVELTLVENVPRERALELYRMADVGVDQLRIGWYGVFATEIAAMGKPVVTSIAAENVVASGLEAPAFTASDESSIREVLRELAARRSELPGIGMKAREFVLARHDAVENARRVVSDYADVCGKRAGSAPSAR